MRLSFDAKTISARESLARCRKATSSVPAPRQHRIGKSPYFMRVCWHLAASYQDDFGPDKHLTKDKSIDRPTVSERWEDATFDGPGPIAECNRRPLARGPSRAPLGERDLALRGLR